MRLIRLIFKKENIEFLPMITCNDFQLVEISRERIWRFKK